MKNLHYLGGLALCVALVSTQAACVQEDGPITPEELNACDAYTVTEPVDLFNGKNFNGWKLFIPNESVDTSTVWSVEDGLIKCTGNPAGYMRTTAKYSNYVLTVEWRFPDGPGNNGVLLHVQDKDEVWPKSIEAQLHSGDAGDFWVIGGTTFKEHTTGPEARRVIKMHDSSEKPLGEWNKYRIECNGNHIKVFVNGLLQNVATDATVCAGYIALQSEGTSVEFRTVKVEPLKAEQ